MTINPLSFAPYLREQVWGGRRLESVLAKVLPNEGPYGEAWELSTHPLHVSRVCEGPLLGTPLSEIWQSVSEQWLPVGQRSDEAFPLLVKWLDCEATLSVQVHPDNANAMRLLGEASGKTEAWVIIDSAPDARIYAGLKPGVDRAELERRSLDGTVADCLHWFHPVRGDVVHIPAGTVHASGGGLVMAEVQQTSDATFRLFDWNRPGPDGKLRPLHREQAFECIDWDRGPVNPVTRLQLDGPRETSLEPIHSCPYFRFQSLSVGREWLNLPGEEMTIVMGLAGSITIGEGEQSRIVSLGETVLLPPNPADWQISSPTDEGGHALIVLPGQAPV